MPTGRSLPDYQQVFIGGYDLSCSAVDAGEQGVEYPESAIKTWCDPVNGVLVGKPQAVFGPLVGTFDNTPTSGWNALAEAAEGVKRYIMLARGVRAAPAMGDDTFCVPMYQTRYKAIGQGIVTARLDFAGVDPIDALNYDEFWGILLHPYGEETAANAANTNVDNGAASSNGGWLMYQIRSITGAGSVTISIDDSATGAAWAALAGAATGEILNSAAPTAGIIQLATNATVRRYLRWQIAFTGPTACTFALAFMRGRNQ